MSGRSKRTKRKSGGPEPRDRQKPESEEDLQPKDPSEMPLEPQNPVDPSPEPAS